MPVVERGKLSWPVAAAAVLATAVVVLLPLGRSQFAGGLWLWGVALVALLGLNLYWPATTTTGGVVKWTTLAGGFAFLAVFPVGRSDSTLLDLGLFAVFGIVCIGTNLVHGFAGKVTLAQAAFLGIGAYVSVLFDTGREITVGGVTTTLPNLPFLVAIAIAGLFCMVVSVLVGFPALRVQGPWLAFVTLAFNLLVFLVLNNEIGLTGGSRGIRILRTDLTIFGIDFFDSRNYYYLCLVFLLVATALVWWIVRSPWGRAFKALRDNPARAASLGVDIRSYTLLAFSIGAGLAGVAGALYARLIEFVDPAGLLHRSVVRLLPRHRRRRPGHAGRPVHRGLVHHRAHRSPAHRRRLLPRVVRPVRDGDDGRRPTRSRRHVQPTPFVVVGPPPVGSGAGPMTRRGDRRRRRRRHRRAGAQHHQVVRRHPGGRRRLVRGPARRDPRRHRPQRLRQDDAVQLHPRPVPGGRRQRRVARPRRQQLAAPSTVQGRPGAHVPAAPGVPVDVRPRQPEDRRPGAHRDDGRPAVPAARPRPRRQGRSARRAIPPGARRRRARRQPELRPAEAARHGDGVRVRPGGRVPRRAGRRCQPDDDRRPQGADRRPQPAATA